MKRQRFKKGFGLIEVLISATIIAIMLGALISVGRMGLASTQNLLARSQATFLAQEGLEIARQARDTAWIDAQADTVWDGFGNNGNTSLLNIINNQASGNPITGWFLYSDRYYWSWQDSNAWESVSFGGISFERKIVFSKVDTTMLPDLGTQSIYPDKNAIKAEATVRWNDGGSTKYISTSELITNWRPSY